MGGDWFRPATVKFFGRTSPGLEPEPLVPALQLPLGDNSAADWPPILGEIRYGH